MGRKIPGKKHKGVKDPDKQRAVRLKKIKNKINTPPTNPDRQDVPKSVQQLMDFTDKLKNGKVNLKRKRKKNNSTLVSSEPKSHNPNKVKRVKRLKNSKEQTPVFIQQKDENDKSFMFRVNNIVKSVIKEAHFEDKYGIKVKRNFNTGQVEDVVKRPKDELDVLCKQAKKDQKQKGKKKKKDEGPRLTKGQKRQKKLAEKKANKAKNKITDFSDFKDTVEFGDIVHGPPTLVTPKRVIKTEGAARPGTKDLLLKSVIKDNETKTKVKFPVSTKKTVFEKIASAGKVDKTGKRKDLPNAVRRQLETQRSEVVNAYRNLKTRKTMNPL